MSIQSDIVTALSAVAGGRVYPFGEVPEETDAPYVVFRRALHNPIMTLGAYAGITNSEFVFECWGEKSDTKSAKAVALDTADAVIAAIEAASGITSKSRLPVSGEDYDDQVLELMEPVQFSFWHS